MRQLLPKAIDPRAAHAALWTPSLRRQLRIGRPPKQVNAAAFDWEGWLKEVFPHLFTVPFAAHHREMWEWGMGVGRDCSPEEDTCVAVFPRGGGKTTNVAGLTAFLLAHGLRDFVAIVGKSFEVSQDRVRSVRSMLESAEFRRRYPSVGEPLTTARGTLIAWNMNLLVTAARQVVAGLSLERFQRGLNVLGMRPDFFILDDVDDMNDTPYRTKTKEKKITKELGHMEGDARPPATIFIQNLIKNDGVVHRLVKGSADWAAKRKVIGPVKAIEGLTYDRIETQVEVAGESLTRVRHVITGGRATWEGQSIERCQAKIDRSGLSAFLEEQQHEVTDLSGALLKSSDFRYREALPVAALWAVVVGLDPCGGSGEYGIVAVGMDKALNYNVLEDASIPPGPEQEDYAERAVLLADQWGADIVVEASYGGELLALKPVRDAAEKLLREKRIKVYPRIEAVNPKLSKEGRARPVAGYYRDGRVYHCGKFTRLEAQWTTWAQDPQPGAPRSPSPDRLDAEVHAVNELESRLEGGEAASLPFASTAFMA